MFEQLLAALVSIAESLKSIAASQAILAGTATPRPPAAADTAGKPAADAGKGKGKDKTTDKTPPAAAPTPAATAAATSGASAVDPTTLPEYQPIKEAVITLVNTGAPGKADVINILSSFGAKKAAEVPQDKWPALLAKLQASLDLVNGEGDDNFA